MVLAPSDMGHRRRPCGTPAAYLASTSNYATAPFIFVCRYSENTLLVSSLPLPHERMCPISGPTLASQHAVYLPRGSPVPASLFLLKYTPDQFHSSKLVHRCFV